MEPSRCPRLSPFLPSNQSGGRCMVKAICGNARKPGGLAPVRPATASSVPPLSAPRRLRRLSQTGFSGFSCFFSVSAAVAADTPESFGQLVPLGSGLAALTPAAYRRRSLRRPSWRSYLGGGFVLRCFQHLSLPDAATRRCTWRHNRLTGGLSNTVLSY